MGESFFGVSPVDGGPNRKSCESGTWSDSSSSAGCTLGASPPQKLWLGRSFNLLKMASAVSLTTVSTESVDEAGESALWPSWPSDVELESNVSTDGLGGGAALG